MNRNELLKNFAIGFIPLFVFIIADEFWGTEVSLVVAVAVGLIYFFYYWLRHRRIEKMILLDTALIVLLGGISIALHNALFFKLKPALVEAILVGLLGVHAFSSRPILLQMSQRYMGDVTIPPQQMQLLKKLSLLLFAVFAAHTALIVYAAYFWSEEAWAFISGGLFYILFAVILAGQWIYLKFFRKPEPPPAMFSDEEIFDIVDEKGKVIGQAPRSAVHGNNQLLHPVVHLHIFHKNGKLYLQKRARSKDLYPGLWDTAVGGHVRSGEDIESALAREAQEELGVAVNNAQFLLRYVIRNAYESELVYLFKMTYNGPFRINREEVEVGRFWTFFEAKKMIGQKIFTPNLEQELLLLERMKVV